MSVTIGSRFSLPLLPSPSCNYNMSRNYASLQDDLSLCYGEDDEDYADQNLHHHYEELPLDDDDAPDQMALITGEQGVPLRQTSTSGQRALPLPASNNIPVDLPDPFPELSHERLGPVSARMYGFDYTRSLSTSPAVAVAMATNCLRDDKSRSPAPICCSGGGSGLVAAEPDLSTKMNIDIYVDDQKCQSVAIDGSTTAGDICDDISMTLYSCKRDSYSTIVEHITKFGLERSLEDHELILPIIRSWHFDENRLYFRKDFNRYELYSNPNQCFPESMVDAKLPKDDASGIMTRHERYRNLLLQNLLANQSIPDIQGFLHIREGKKAWKKYYCVLRHSGLYYITKGTVKDPRHMALLSDLTDVNLCVAVNAKKVFSSPTQYCICLVPSSDTRDKHRLKQICAEDEQSRLCWITGMRFVKFGSQLQANFRASVRFNNNSSGSSNKDGKVNSPLYDKSQVAMDFSGSRGRVVIDPAEAMVVAMEEWRKRRVQPSRTSSSSCKVQDSPPCEKNKKNLQFQYTPEWFHDAIGRDEAVSLISARSQDDGTFLVRNSQSLPGVYVLSFMHNFKVKHCTIHKIKLEGCWYFSLDGGSTKFLDLTQLIDFYLLNSGRLPTRLTHPVTR